MPIDTMSVHLESCGILVSITGESNLIQSVRDAIREEFEQQKAEALQPKHFSEASPGDADALLLEMNLGEINGDLMEPIIVPPGQPVADEFDYSRYPIEDAGTPAFIGHHKQQLTKFDVKFGRGGFEA